MTQFFRIIRDQSESMRYLIGDLLDVARIETGALPVSPEPVDVASLVDEARSRFPERGRPGQPGHRPAAGPAPGHGGPAAHRPGAGQPALQRGQALERAVPHPGGRCAGWRPRRLLGGGRRRGRARRAAAAPVPQVLAARRRGTGTGDSRVGPGTRHLQGHRGGPRGPHPGRERRAWPGKPVHLHRSGGGGDRRPPPSTVHAGAGRRPGSDPASSAWTTTRRRSGTSGMRSPRRATRPS